MTLKQWNQIYELAKSDYESKNEIAKHRRDMYIEQEDSYNDPDSECRKSLLKHRERTSRHTGLEMTLGICWIV